MIIQTFRDIHWTAIESQVDVGSNIFPVFEAESRKLDRVPSENGCVGFAAKIVGRHGSSCRFKRSS